MGQFWLQTFYDPSMFHFLFYLCIYSIYSMFFQLKLPKVVVTKHNLALFLLPWQFFKKVNWIWRWWRSSFANCKPISLEEHTTARGCVTWEEFPTCRYPIRGNDQWLSLLSCCCQRPSSSSQKAAMINQTVKCFLAEKKIFQVYTKLNFFRSKINGFFLLHSKRFDSHLSRLLMENVKLFKIHGN